MVTHIIRGGWRSGAILLVALTIILAAAIALLPGRADAHGFLDRSEPAANAVVPEAPSEVSLWFTEPLEPEYSRAELFDASGVKIPTEPRRIGDDNQMLLTLPADLPDGTYTIQWRNISTVDGHPQQGFVPFTIGSRSDVVTPQAPTVTTFSKPPTWLDSLGRWLSLLGITGATGSVVCWLFVLRQAREPLDDAFYDRVQRRFQRLVLFSIGVGIVGSLIALGVQVATAGDGFSVQRTLDVLIDSRFGHLWLARTVLLLGLGAIVASGSLWDERPSMSTVALTLGLAGGAMLPYALNSHAAAQVTGEDAAVAADWLHLAASSVWIGGLLALLVTLIYGTRGSARDQRRQAFAIAVTRFTTVALASVIILALTGFYAAWLQVGNLIALRETSYGQTLILKLALLVPMLILGAINMRVIGPRMLTAARSGVHFGRTVAAEVMLGIGILATVGLLTTLPTARDTVTQEAENTTFHLNRNDVHSILYISPGSAGLNRYTADIAIDGLETPASVQVILILTKQGDVEGIREIQLPYNSGNRFEASGSDLSVTGAWDLEFIVRREGQADVRFEEEMNVRSTPPAERVPGQPPRFVGTTSAGAVLFGGLAIVAIVASLRTPGVWQDRAVGSGIGAALLLAGGLILAVNRHDPTLTTLATNPIPVTTDSLSAGQQVFQANCAACHGPEGKGDGPAGANLNPQPADLTASHAAVHTDGDMLWWISNGIDPAMPPFGDALNEADIWNVINYVRSLSGPSSASED